MKRIYQTLITPSGELIIVHSFDVTLAALELFAFGVAAGITLFVAAI